MGSGVRIHADSGVADCQHDVLAHLSFELLLGLGLLQLGIVGLKG